MMTFIRCAALVLMLVPAPSAAQDFDVGAEAKRAGDYATALREWKPLAERGHSQAQAALAYMYRRGMGVQQDQAEAVRWERSSAVQGNAVSQFGLGNAYRHGQGVPQDYVTAHMWYNVSAANGSKMASHLRDIVGLDMTPESIVEAQRRARVCMESGYQDCD